MPPWTSSSQLLEARGLCAQRSVAASTADTKAASGRPFVDPRGCKCANGQTLMGMDEPTQFVGEPTQFMGEPTQFMGEPTELHINIGRERWTKQCGIVAEKDPL
jgi:hypothetical protein